MPAMNLEHQSRRNRRPETNIEEALDMISTGLLLLEQANLQKIAGRKAVDVTAKINAQSLALEKILKPMRDRLKAKALEDGTDYLRGNVMKMRVNSFLKTYWLMEAVKEFLGTKSSHFQETRTEHSVSFELQE